MVNRSFNQLEMDDEKSPVQKKCELCCFFFACSLNFVLPIVELSLQGVYGDQITCTPKILGLRNWIIVDAVITILVAIVKIGKKKSELNILDSLNFYLFWSGLQFVVNLLSFIWIVLGSIIFWGNCRDQPPEQINTLMHVVLILGYINIYANIPPPK